MATPMPARARKPVLIGDAEILIERLRETDADVFEVVSGADDPEDATHRCLQMGARTLRFAQASVDTAAIEREFETMQRSFDQALSSNIDTLTERTDALLDGEDGALTAALSGWKDDVSTLLGSTFDPQSKVSVLAKMEKVLEDAAEHQLTAMRRLINPDLDGSPLNRWKADIIKAVREQSAAMLEELHGVSEKLSVDQATAQVYDLTTRKGLDFEDLVHEVVSRVAVVHGDLAEKVGTENGAAGSKAGDEVVTLNADDTDAIPAQFTLEAKDRSMGSRAVLAELSEAMENREAAAAIAVFASQKQAPTAVPFSYSDNSAIAVLDRETGDGTALHLAYMWARWVVRRQLSDDRGEGHDAERLRALIDRAARSLERCSSIRRAHTIAGKKIGEAGTQVSALAAEVEEALAELRAELQ